MSTLLEQTLIQNINIISNHSRSDSSAAFVLNQHHNSQNNFQNLQVTPSTTTTKTIIMNAQQQHQQQQHLGFWDSITDERVNEFYLLRGGPTIILSIVAVYLYFVLSLGPKLMRNFQPFKLNKLLLSYNVGLALANLWLFIQGLLVSNYGLDTLGCGKFGGDIAQSPRRGIYLGYLFFLTKLIELLDTVFFVLRKKHQQITFLHVFHHSVVPFFCWIGIKLAPGGPNGFFPLVNSFIHVIMYSYYALTTFGPRVQPYLWWKKYLTTIQMIQFILVMCNAFNTFMSQDCKFPILFAYLQATVAIAFFILFAFFYHDAYHKKKRSASSSSLVTTTPSAKLHNLQPVQKLSSKTQLSNNINNNNNNNDERLSSASSRTTTTTTTFALNNNVKKANIKLI